MEFHDLSEPGMNYWSSTDEVLASHGGEMPTCFICKQRMYPIDDHGRFACVPFPGGPPAEGGPQETFPNQVISCDGRRAGMPAGN